MARPANFPLTMNASNEWLDRPQEVYYYTYETVFLIQRNHDVDDHEDCSTEVEKLGRGFEEKFGFDIGEAKTECRGTEVTIRQREHADRTAENSTYSTDGVRRVLLDLFHSPNPIPLCESTVDVLLMMDCCCTRNEQRAAERRLASSDVVNDWKTSDWCRRCRCSKDTASLDIPLRLHAEDNGLLYFDLQCFDPNPNIVRNLSLHLAAQAHEDIMSRLCTASASMEKSKNGFEYCECMSRLIGEKGAFLKGGFPAPGFVAYALIDSVAEHLKDVSWHRSLPRKGDINGCDMARSVYSSSWKNWMGSNPFTFRISGPRRSFTSALIWALQQMTEARGQSVWTFPPRRGPADITTDQVLRARSVLNEFKDSVFAGFRTLVKALLGWSSSTSLPFQKLFWLLPMSTNVAAHPSWVPSLPQQFYNSRDHLHEHFAQGKEETHPWICSLTGSMNEQSILWFQFSKDPAGTCAAHGDAIVLRSALCFSIAALLLYRSSSNCRRRRIALVTSVVAGSVISIGKGLRVVDILLQVLPVVLLVGMVCNYVYDRIQCCRKVPWLEQTASCDHLKCSNCGQNCCSEKYKQQDW